MPAETGGPAEVASGRRILLVVGGICVPLAALLGLFVGENGATTVSEVSVFGLVALPTTPLTMALYGAVVATVALVAAFSLISLASRFDDA